MYAESSVRIVVGSAPVYVTIRGGALRYIPTPRNLRPAKSPSNIHVDDTPPPPPPPSPPSPAKAIDPSSTTTTTTAKPAMVLLDARNCHDLDVQVNSAAEQSRNDKKTFFSAASSSSSASSNIDTPASLRFPRGARSLDTRDIGGGHSAHREPSDPYQSSSTTTTIVDDPYRGLHVAQATYPSFDEHRLNHLQVKWQCTRIIEDNEPPVSCFNSENSTFLQSL